MLKLRNLTEIRNRWSNCTSCKLCETRGDTKPVFGSGDPRAKIFAVGAKVSIYEGEAGKPMQGPVGKLFDEILTSVGLDRTDIFITNLTICKIDAVQVKGTWKVPDPNQTCIKKCQFRLMEELEAVSPKIIVVMGTLPAKYFFGKVPLRRRWRESQDPRFRFYYTRNPAAAMDNRGGSAELAEIRSHWKEIAEAAKEM